MLKSSNNSHREATDEELVARYRAGESESFDELVARYTPALYNLIYRFTGSRAEAEQLTQESWLRIWAVLPRIKLDSPIRPYLLRVAVNLCRTWSAKRTMPPLDLDSKEIVDRAGEQADDLVERLSEEELQGRVRSAVAKLPPTYRAAIILRYSQGLSYAEIARVLHLPLNTVRTHLRRAKARLHELLQDDRRETVE